MSLPDPFQLVATTLKCAPDSLSAESGLDKHPMWDSFGHVEIMMALEQDYGVEINDASIRRYQDMAAIIERHGELSADDQIGFDERWETDVYGVGRMMNRYPSEVIVSFLLSSFSASQRAGLRVLDLGCGAGNNTAFLAREGCDVLAVDGSASAIDNARARMAADGLKADLRVMDFTALDVPDQSVDCVIDRCSITHNRRAGIEKILAEVRRVLKPGGLFFSQMFTTDIADRSFGTPLGDGSYAAFTAGYFADVALTFFADRGDVDDLYGRNFTRQSLRRVLTEDESGRVVMAVWNTVWHRD